MTKETWENAIQLIESRATRALRRRAAINKKQGCPTTDNSKLSDCQTLIKSYARQLRGLNNATESGNKIKIKAARERIFDSFAGRLIATVQAADDIATNRSFDDLESRANQLSMHQKYNEVVTIKPDPKPGKPGEWRPIGLSGRQRKAQQYILRDILLVTIGDSPCDSTVTGAGGETALFNDIANAIGLGYQYWASLDIRGFFSSLRPGHLAGFRLPKWVIENLIFLPLDAPIRFIDPTYGLELSEETILKGDDADLPDGYPYTMDDIGSKLKMVRQGLIQGDVCAPQIARAVLGRELRRVLEKWDVLYGSHLDNVLIGARSLAELKASIEALTHRLKSHPAGPLELHQHEIRHIKDDIYHLGNRVGLLKNGQVHVRPSLQRFDRFRTRLWKKLKDSTAFTKGELVEAGLVYARRWFAAQPAWTKAGVEPGSSKCEGASWEYMVDEVFTIVSAFIYDEMLRGIWCWHDDDVDFERLRLAGYEIDI